MTQMSNKTESMKKIEVSREHYVKLLIAVGSPSEEEKSLYGVNTKEFKKWSNEEIVRVANSLTKNNTDKEGINNSFTETEKKYWGVE